MQSTKAAAETLLARVPCTIRETAGLARVQEPVVVGLPLPRGTLRDEDCACDFRTADGVRRPCQIVPRSHWPDGSVKWLSVYTSADVAALGTCSGELCLAPGARHEEPAFALREIAEQIELSYGDGRWVFDGGGSNLVRHWRSGLDGKEVRDTAYLWCVDASGVEHVGRIESAKLEQIGPLRADVRLRGRVMRCGGLRFSALVSVFAHQRLLRMEVTLENPARARHAGGCWDLGDPASVPLRGWRLEWTLADAPHQGLDWSTQLNGPRQSVDAASFSIRQWSSGGENWNARTHVDRTNQVPLRFRGYQIQCSLGESTGLRAAPTLRLRRSNVELSCALTEFWEKFPSGLACDGAGLDLEFCPESAENPHELQPGEHWTRVAWLHWHSTATPVDLSWVHAPLAVSIDPGWIAKCEAIPFLPQSAANMRDEHGVIAHEALEGAANFFAKREIIDEYGWRNFGDTWADHEAAYFKGPSPIISHYNNQYDLLHSLLIQYLLTGDQRWWRLADPLARHVMDIDIYHTDRDKSAYSGGLFWHTAHYVDAATCTHRTYSKAMGGLSGGPANEQAYSSGLLLYHQLTGDHRARQTVLTMADWILKLDSGADHLLGLASDRPTGRASCTTVSDYHGPGRGAGNAIGVLLDAWLAGGGDHYIDYAENLTRRTIHPDDDIAARDLNDFERRWSYTVYLLQLARYLQVTAGANRLAVHREYVKQSLLNYADWIAEHSRFTLDYPEQLEYPTETWAAQELRKGNVLLAAARHCPPGPRHERLLERGDAILKQAWDTLLKFPSRNCTRPLALALQQSYLEEYFRNAAPLDEPAGQFEFPRRETFVSQTDEVRALRRSPRAMAIAATHLLRPARWLNQIRRSWAAERVRRALDV